jgi:murein DD-endopeptidase MepM/ murein hydrolase activator NlpD
MKTKQSPPPVDTNELDKKIVKTKWPAALLVALFCIGGVSWKVFTHSNTLNASAPNPANKVKKAALPPKEKQTYVPLAAELNNSKRLINKGISVKQAPPSKPIPQTIVINGSIEKKDSFSKIISKANVTSLESLKMVKASRKVLNLSKLRLGKKYKIELSPEGQFNHFEYYLTNSSYFRLENKGNTYKSEIRQYELETDFKVIQGSIKRSLIADVLKAGGTYQSALDLTEIFAWDVNFYKDIRKGDKFKFIAETKTLDGKFVKNGKILAAILETRKKTFDAVYFESPDGSARYYTSTGKPLVKQFLKAPLKYRRISSRYTYRRFHPVYKKYMPHLGVDYAAPTGTPVVALADGVVARTGRNGRAGKYVALTHYGIYRTAYSHLSRFAKGVRKGRKVHQGQVIGYVGTTGSSTGPHLDFQLKKFGKPLNPLSFKSPGGPPVKKTYKEAFLQNSIQKLYILGESESALKVVLAKPIKQKKHAKKIASAPQKKKTERL